MQDPIRLGLKKMTDIQVERVYENLSGVKPTFSSCTKHRRRLQTHIRKLLSEQKPKGV